MVRYLKWLFLLALWDVILFFAKDLGINVILFIAPLMFYMYYVLKKNDKIKNPSGLLFMITILLLSFTYILFDTELFMVLNVFAIPLLIALMVIYTTDSTYDILKLFSKLFEYFTEPFNYISRLYRVVKNRLSFSVKIPEKTIKVLKSLVVVVPITIFILVLLSSADMMFGKIIDKIFGNLIDFFKLEIFDNLISKIILFLVIFFAIGCTTMFILYSKKESVDIKAEENNVDLLTSKILVSVLNVIYIVFDFIQIKSLLLHSVSNSINYAEYARRGFFELLVVSLINLAIILIIRRYENKNNTKEFNYIKIMEIIMIFLTIVIIASSFIRMHMYEMEYGYTVLRLLVFAALITEAILMIPTVMYIFNKDFNIVKSYMLIILISYLCINYMNMDYTIARRNVNRYYYKNDIDLDYLENDRYSNIPILIDLYNKTEDRKIKDSLEDYLYGKKENVLNLEHSIFEFNVPYYKARNILNKTELQNNKTEYKDYLFR